MTLETTETRPVFTLTVEDGYKPIRAELGSRDEAIRYAYLTCGIPAYAWSRIGMAVNDTEYEGLRARIGQPSRQFCRGCLISVDAFTTVHYGPGHRLHFCHRPPCRTKLAEYLAAG